MRIAVIIPLYNGARWIEATLAAVRAQTRPADEILVIDDGSTDDSVERAAGFNGVTVLRNPGKGPNPARAHGLGLVVSEWVGLLDQDDLWHPEHLERLAAELGRFPEAPAAVGGVARFRDGFAPRFATGDPGGEELDPWTSCPLCPITTPSQVLFRRAVLAEAGGWGAQRVGGADFEAWLRIGARRPLRVLKATTVGYRLHQTSYSVALRRSDRMGFLDRSLAGAADCLQARVRWHPSHATELAARIGFARALVAWARAESAGKGRMALRRAEAALGVVGAEGAWLVFEKFYYFFDDAGGVAAWPAKAAFLARLWLACPPGASRLRAEVSRRIWFGLWRRPVRRPGP